MSDNPRMKQLEDLLDGRRLSDEQVVKIIQLLFSHVENMRATVDKLTKEKGEELSNLGTKLKSDTETATGQLKQQVNVLFVENRLKEIEADIRTLYAQSDGEIKTKLASVKDGERGDRGDEGPPGKDGSPDTPLQVVMKVNEHKGVQQEAITGLKEKLAELDRIITAKRGTIGSTFGAVGPSVIVKTLFNQSFSETPDGARTTFILAKAPRFSGAERIYQNGVRMDPGSSNDYTVTGKTVTFNTAPITGDKLRYDIEY